MSDDETVANNKTADGSKNGTKKPPPAAPCLDAATEADPCMDQDDELVKKTARRKKRVTSSAAALVERWENAAREKTGLSRRGVYYVGGLVVLLVCLFVAVVALAATWPVVPHSKRFPVCKDTACLKAIAQIRESVDLSKSPCEDVWSWACGGWLAKNRLPPERSVWNMEQQLALNEARKIRDLISTLPPSPSTGTVEWKLKNLYETCMGIDSVNADKARPLTNIISEMGGWYILRNWNMEDFDARSIMRQLHVKHGVTPFFKFSVEPNPILPGRYSITIKPAGLGLPDQRYYYTEDETIHNAYKQLIRDVVINLGAATMEAEKFANDIYHYEKRIAEITPDSYDLQNPVRFSYNLYKLSELKESTLMLPLLDILMAMYPESNVTEETEVIVHSYEYLTRVSQIVSTTDRTTMNSYLIWTLVKDYLPYLSSNFVAAIDSFNNALYGTRVPIKRWEFCVDFAQRFMGLATSVFISRQYPVDNDAKVAAEGMFGSIKNATFKYLDRYQRKPDLHRHLKQKLANLKLQIGIPRHDDADAHLKSHYSKLRVVKANLFENYASGVGFLKRLEDDLLTSRSADLRDSFQLTRNPTSVSYSPSANAVVVPELLMREPHFHPKYPAAVLYGRFGFDAAGAVASAIFPYENIWTADLKVLSPYHSTVNDSIAAISSAVGCLTSSIENRKLIPIDANLTSLSALKSLAAVEIAHQALLADLLKFQHTHQPTLEDYEDPAIFFLSFSQKMCSFATPQRIYYEVLVRFRLPEKSLLLLTSQEATSFRSSLSCDKPSGMKCTK